VSFGLTFLDNASMLIKVDPADKDASHTL